MPEEFNLSQAVNSKLDAIYLRPQLSHSRIEEIARQRVEDAAIRAAAEAEYQERLYRVNIAAAQLSAALSTSDLTTTRMYKSREHAAFGRSFYRTNYVGDGWILRMPISYSDRWSESATRPGHPGIVLAKTGEAYTCSGNWWHQHGVLLYRQAGVLGEDGIVSHFDIPGDGMEETVSAESLFSQMVTFAVQKQIRINDRVS